MGGNQRVVELLTLLARGRFGCDGGTLEPTGKDLLADFFRYLGILLEEDSRLLFPLPQVDLAILEPRAAATDDLLIDPHVDDVPFVADAASVQHVELSDAERRCYLVLDDLGADALADHFFPFLELVDAANVDPERGVEL